MGDWVYLSATAEQKSATQSERDAARLKNAVKRVTLEIDSVFNIKSKMDLTLKKAWVVGEALGNSAARRQCNALGFDKPTLQKADKAIFVSLKRDLHKIYSEGDSAQTRLRARMCVEAAVKMSFNSVFVKVMQTTNTRKMWKTTSAIPCHYCTFLDGVEAPWEEEFPKTFGDMKPIKIYGGTLFHPPLHPNCKCILVPIILSEDERKADNG